MDYLNALLLLLADPVVLVGMIRKLTFGILACLAVLIYSVWMDKRSGIDRRDAARKMMEDAKAFADYRGKRWLGICFIFGMCFSV